MEVGGERGGGGMEVGGFVVKFALISVMVDWVLKNSDLSCGKVC